MFSLPSEFCIYLELFRQLFSVSVWASAQILVMGTILCQGNRTVSSVLRAVGLENSPNYRNYHSWEPTRRIIFLVDGGFASFDLLEECCRLHTDPVEGKREPKPKKGESLPSLKI